MPPKRGRSFVSYRNNKRKKLSLVALQEQLRQKKFYRNQGPAKKEVTHPADEEVTTRSNVHVKEDDLEDEQENDISESSDSEEEEAPAMQQLLQEIGVQEEEPESERDSEDEDDDDDDDAYHDDLLNGADDVDEEEEEEGEDADDIDDESHSDDEGDDESLRKTNGASFLNDEADEYNGMEEEEGGDEEEGKETDDDEEGEEEMGDEEEEVSDEEADDVDDEDYEQSEEEEEEDDNDSDEVEEDEKSSDGANKEDVKDDPVVKQKKKPRPLDIMSDDDCFDQEDPDAMSKSDPFSLHLEREVDVDEFLEMNKEWIKKDIKVPGLGKSVFSYRNSDFLRVIKSSTDLKGEHVKHKLCNNVSKTNKKYAGVDLPKKKSLTSFQYDLFNVLNTYQDLLYPKQTVKNEEEIRMVYCLHALNHALKTRSTIISNDFKIKQGAKVLDEDVELRDQGLTRPTVLIVLPYREKAKKVVNILIHLLSASEKVKAGSWKRFVEDFSETEKTDVCGKNHKPEDYVQLFDGNIDDNFLIGLSISKSSLKLYTKRYGSDIIIASPLGLRSLISAPKDKRDFEFLSSIEMLIMDQSDVYMMQNWDHVVSSLQHFHLQPKASHNVDFSRVRMWAIDGLSKYFRQTIIFSHVLLPEFISVFNKYCHNYCGKIMVEKNEKVGSVRSCLSDVPQIFHRVPCSKPDGISQRNAKLEYFKTKLLYLHNAAGMRRTLIYCNYFSFVVLRNLFREEGLTFLFINEYDDEKEIKKSRRKFRQGLSPFMLHTERLHFHHRCRLRGACHIVWFDLPQYPAFYPELVNLMEITKQACTSTCLFTKYEGQKLMEIVGLKNAGHMMNSEKAVNMITLS